MDSVDHKSDTVLEYHESAHENCLYYYETHINKSVNSKADLVFDWD